ncbi:MAG: hypothetical protein Q9180_009551, partial [Flavoplaca navasiana]
MKKHFPDILPATPSEDHGHDQDEETDDEKAMATARKLFQKHPGSAAKVMDEFNIPKAGRPKLSSSKAKAPKAPKVPKTPKPRKTSKYPNPHVRARTQDDPPGEGSVIWEPIETDAEELTGTTGKLIADRRRLGGTNRRFDTYKYKAYSTKADLRDVARVFPYQDSFADYNDYRLYMNADLKAADVAEIPKSKVRLDDFAVGMVLLHGNFSHKQLNEYWPAEFDNNGMIRASRAPLGNPFKVKLQHGSQDMYGKTFKGNTWVYGSWKGLHQLCGEEGLAAGRYWVRPSFEHFKAP